MEAQRQAQLAAQPVSVAVAPVSLPVATAVPMATAPLVVATPTAVPSSAPVLYSHNPMPQLYRPAAGPTAEVEMRPLAAAPVANMYPGVGINGYSRLQQAEV